MDRLWVRLSLAIGGLFFGLLGLLIVVILAASMMGVILPVFDDGRPRLHEIWRDLPEGVAGLLLFTGVIGIISGVLVSRILSAPITNLAAAAHRIGEGDLSTRVALGGSREIRELAQSFNKMATDLQRAEELRNNLMADVSHELRTPLTALEGNLRAALDHVYELDEAELAHLYGQTRHLIQLVNDLRELALAEANKLLLHRAPADIAALIYETCGTFEPLAAEKGVALTVQVATELPSLRLDEVRIRQVLHNLIANALRHTPAGGTIAITAQTNGDGVALTIADTGEGVDEAQLPHLFDRFYRTDQSRTRASGGTGLGLAIVKAVVEEHGGRVGVVSAGRGQGMTIHLHFSL